MKFWFLLSTFVGTTGAYVNKLGIITHFQFKWWVFTSELAAVFNP